MSEEIVRMLRLRSQERIKLLKESLPVKGLREEDEEEEDPIDDIPAEETLPGEEDSPSDELPSKKLPDEEIPVEDEEEEVITPEDDDMGSDEEENINPLDNPYATKYTLGQEVVLAYSNGSKSKLKGTIEGYDKEGFYRIKWASGKTTSGITDIALADLLDETNEDKCICGSTHIVTEGSKVVCDSCGRVLRESSDPLSVADKSRPKGKKLIRSEAHPVSTSLSDSIKKAFQKKESIREMEDYNLVFDKLTSELDGVFWTRMSELADDIRELGYEVEDLNSEYVVVYKEDEEGNGYELKIPVGGTARTITLDFERAELL